MAKKNLAKIAKRKPAAKKTTTKKNKPEVVEETPLTKNEIADKLVEGVMDDVELKPSSDSQLIDDQLIVIEGNENNVEWLQEQLGLMTQSNTELKGQADTAKENYKKIFDELQALKDGDSNIDQKHIQDTEIKKGVVALFNEVQDNYLGHNERNSRYSDMKMDHLLKKMINIFPFVNDIRKF
jgi:hypothetical protein